MTPFRRAVLLCAVCIIHTLYVRRFNYLFITIIFSVRERCPCTYLTRQYNDSGRMHTRRSHARIIALLTLYTTRVYRFQILITPTKLWLVSTILYRPPTRLPVGARVDGVSTCALGLRTDRGLAIGESDLKRPVCRKLGPGKKKYSGWVESRREKDLMQFFRV